MAKVLGLDLGTNSLGWALVDESENGYTLIDKGVDIFQEGVARDKNNEKPAVQDRTNARALRRHHFRRRLRKIELLKVLVRYDLCPPVSEEQLSLWKKKKLYPLNEEFLRWQRTDDNVDRNPYHDRYVALTERLDLGNRTQRWMLGRALYHLAQRRGFLSNRKDAGSEKDDGTVKESIKNLSAEMKAAGCNHLGEYFYELYQHKKRIRGRYTSRNEHYLAEFNAICDRQQLPDEWCQALYRSIFFQRNLKSQKGSVGQCTFEPRKSRCPVSHPRFEEYRMLSFINNIRITGSDDNAPRPLTLKEVETIRPLFFRKSKPYFDFEEIARKIAGKGRYACKEDRIEAPYRFNFTRTSTVSGCPVTASLMAVFGDEWLQEIRSLYLLGNGKSEEQVLNDVWHVLFSFTDEERLRDWAVRKLQLSDEQAKAFASIKLPQDYAALSLNAINKIVRYLRRGYRYDEAVFLANLQAALPKEIYEDEKRRHEIEQDIASLLLDYKRNPYDRFDSKERRIAEYFTDHGVDATRLERLYHPSKIEVYPDARPDTKGTLQLGSPRTSAIRNPMAMRALFRLRNLINTLLREGRIDRDTKIRIEFARGLNDANRRKAIEQYQRERESENRKYTEEIRHQYAAETGREIEPSEIEVLKYRLWEEQQHVCPYTGRQIRISDFVGSAPDFDIEHTLPRARGGDDSQMNKTLCENRFNRETKRAKLPTELSNHAEILERIESFGWREKVESLQKQIEAQVRRSKGAATKSEKDNAIQRRHYLQMQLDYWRGKYERFTMTEVPEGFSNRQGVDIGIIGKYARLYLKTVFDRIYTVKGSTTAAFRKMWGLQEEYARKERTNHVHHCIDAITIACIGQREYDRWAQYAADEEQYRYGENGKPNFEKPWPTFTEDVKAVGDALLVAHHTPDNMAKQTRKRLRIRGKVKLNADGKPIYQQGNSARCRLHQDTFYGAIERDGEIRYVVRKTLGQLQPGDIDKIVDDTVRDRVREAIDEVGFKTATNPDEYTIWMNREKGVPIRKVRIFTPSVTQPIALKRQRDLSEKEYKRDYHVANDGNYCIAIYEGYNKKGKTKRTFELISNLEAAQYFKASTDRDARPDLVPQADTNGFPLKCILKTGTMVLFYEDSPAELYDCSHKELARRLYKVTGFSTLTVSSNSYGRLTLKHHQEARPAGELKAKSGEWKTNEEYRPVISLLHTQLNAYVEGYDFELTVTGEIKFKHGTPC
ncbi:MAG TPA: CRISPR-associated protein Csn1 [Candidatus Alistipes avicola]|uniref:CRISPR-associated endonuclease Cas9 n=1 Tax=Candidatus Alistipes avicola TaxID=2838432 RepID=A0A9D2L4U4_9BACT|nr:type II CRISPR RNA-guided endonuclease Cas9 [uncultured Alistipes sp.]HJA99233.1 CRISPR-associated protein Csn1 [Candidatus Alistipes avicola]